MKGVVLTASAVVLSGVAVVALNSREEGSCSTTYEFEGRAYVAYETTSEVTPRNVLGSGTESGCGDEGVYLSAVAMYDVSGVRPQVAVVSAVNARAIYIAQGAGVSDLPPGLAAVVVR